MTKFTEPLIDTPQTVSVVPQFVLKEQANHTLGMRCAMFRASAWRRVRLARRATT